jgi:hypothetical protein
MRILIGCWTASVLLGGMGNNSWLDLGAPADAVPYVAGYLGKEVKVVGARWRHGGFGPIPASLGGIAWDSGDATCVCMNGRFSVDGYGRVFLPNPFLFCVEVVDTAGNRLYRVGSYGNADSAGPGSRVPEPPVAFAFAPFVSASGDWILISDIVSRRVAALRMRYAEAVEGRLP